MKVFVAGILFDSRQLPIVLVLNDIDKATVKQMEDEDRYFFSGPTTMTDDGANEMIRQAQVLDSEILTSGVEEEDGG